MNQNDFANSAPIEKLNIVQQLPFPGSFQKETHLFDIIESGNPLFAA